MEILNIGSFVPLDNRERIEQLKFTAQEMASEVANSEGFENAGPTNQQIALEMWKGAEYMCRAHEENTVRNIFLSTFLERLRDLAKETRLKPPPQPVPSRPPNVPKSVRPVIAYAAHSPVVPIEVEPLAPAVIETTAQVSTPAPNAPPPVEATDEFLCIVPSMEDTPPENIQTLYADECDPGYDAAIEALVDKLESEVPVRKASGSSETVEAITKEPFTDAVEAASHEESTSVIPASTGPISGDEATEETAAAESEMVEPTEVESIGSIVLAEKEPYNFDSCTVTSVIHLFPESHGIRKCVASVRSHDFVPQITTSEVANDNVAEDIKRGLESAFEQYRKGLPALAADKIKKEKPAAKKRSTKPAEKTTAATQTSESEDSGTTQATQVSEAAQVQNTLFAS